MFSSENSLFLQVSMCSDGWQFQPKVHKVNWVIVWGEKKAHFYLFKSPLHSGMSCPVRSTKCREVDLTGCLLCLFCWRTNTLLEKVAAAVEQSAFYSALWGSILTSPAVRLPGVSFVLLHLNRKLSMEDQLYVMGNDIELMVCDSTLLGDNVNQIISSGVQRLSSCPLWFLLKFQVSSFGSIYFMWVYFSFHRTLILNLIEMHENRNSRWQNN